MQRIDGDDHGVLHALNPDDDLGRHALQHFRGLVQGNYRGIAGHARGAAGGFVDFGNAAFKSLIADGADCHGSALAEFQGHDVAFVDVDGDFHALVRREGRQRGFSILDNSRLVIFDAADRAGKWSGHAAVPVDLHQLEQVVFHLAAFLHQRLVMRGVFRTGQGKKRGTRVHGTVHRGIHRSDGAADAGNAQGAVHAERTASQGVAVGIQYGDFLSDIGFYVRYQHHSLAFLDAFNRAAQLLLI